MLSMILLSIQSIPYSSGSSHPNARGVTMNVVLLPMGARNADEVAKFEKPNRNMIELLDPILEPGDPRGVKAIYLRCDAIQVRALMLTHRFPFLTEYLTQSGMEYPEQRYEHPP
jgi:hypothetical protein